MQQPRGLDDLWMASANSMLEVLNHFQRLVDALHSVLDKQQQQQQQQQQQEQQQQREHNAQTKPFYFGFVDQITQLENQYMQCQYYQQQQQQQQRTSYLSQENRRLLQVAKYLFSSLQQNLHKVLLQTTHTMQEFSENTPDKTMQPDVIANYLRDGGDGVFNITVSDLLQLEQSLGHHSFLIGEVFNQLFDDSFSCGSAQSLQCKNVDSLVVQFELVNQLVLEVMQQFKKLTGGVLRLKIAQKQGQHLNLCPPSPSQAPPLCLSLNLGSEMLSLQQHQQQDKEDVDNYNYNNNDDDIFMDFGLMQDDDYHYDEDTAVQFENISTPSSTSFSPPSYFSAPSSTPMFPVKQSQSSNSPTITTSYSPSDDTPPPERSKYDASPSPTLSSSSPSPPTHSAFSPLTTTHKSVESPPSFNGKKLKFIQGSTRRKKQRAYDGMVTVLRFCRKGQQQQQTQE